MKAKGLLTVSMVIAIMLWACIGVSDADADIAAGDESVRFVPVHVYIDSGDVALAAWQVEVVSTTGNAKVVGIESGGHEAFDGPPYYDSAAMMNERIIVAAFTTKGKLPTGRGRVVTLHMQITGDVEPEYEVVLMAAADANTNKISAKVSIESGTEK